MKLAAAATFVVLCLARPLAAQDPDSMVPPRLLNADVVKKTLDEAYPVGLSRSGICELDVAGLNVAHRMRFKPAERDGERITSWVEIPIIFTAKR